MGQRELRQDVVKLFPRIHLKPFAGLNDRGDGRDFRTSFLASDMDIVCDQVPVDASRYSFSTA